MNPQRSPSSRILLLALVTFAVLFAPLFPVSALAEEPSATNLLPLWNEGSAKQAIVDFVKATTDKSSPGQDFVGLFPTRLRYPAGAGGWHRQANPH